MERQFINLQVAYNLIHESVSGPGRVIIQTRDSRVRFITTQSHIGLFKRGPVPTNKRKAPHFHNSSDMVLLRLMDINPGCWIVNISIADFLISFLDFVFLFLFLLYDFRFKDAAEMM